MLHCNTITQLFFYNKTTVKSVWTIYSMNFFINFSAATCLFQNEPNAFRHFGNGIVNPELGNGGFLGWRFRVNSVVVMGCIYHDYQISGSANRTCQANGTWSYQGPVCSEGNTKFTHNDK